MLFGYLAERLPNMSNVHPRNFAISFIWKKILGRPKVEGQYAVHNLFFVLKHNLRTTAAYWAQCRKLLIGRGSGLPSSEKNWELTLSPRPYDTLENSDSWNFWLASPWEVHLVFCAFFSKKRDGKLWKITKELKKLKKLNAAPKIWLIIRSCCSAAPII